MAANDPPTIHYTELPPAAPGSQLAAEWETYRREVARLIAEGHEGKWVLIKQDDIIGIFPDQGTAVQEGYLQFQRDGFLIHKIQQYERLRRPSLRFFQSCPPSALPLRQTA
jgi:hypothetical protein